MISRIAMTCFLAVLSIGAFFSEATWAARSDDHVFFVLGIFAAALAFLTWFQWEKIREGWDFGRPASGAEGAKLPSLAWSWPIYINSIFNLWRPYERHRPGSKR